MSSNSPVSPLSLSPVSPMSPAIRAVRPPHLLFNQHSSSLSGMEIAVPSPLTPAFKDSRPSSSKALPPTPGKAPVDYFSPRSALTLPESSINLKHERPRTPRSALKDEVLPSETLLVPPATRSTTSSVPDQLLQWPQLKRDALTQGASDFATLQQPSGDPIFTEWKAPRSEYSDDEYGSSLPASREASRQGSWALSENAQSAEDRANDYTSVLPTFNPPPPTDSDFLPVEMSARITDLFDGSLMPAPLVLTSNSEDRKLSSQFSESESEDEESKLSLRSRARKALKPRKVSRERREKSPADLKLSQHSQSGDSTPSNRASLQNGIDEMYNTLTGLYSPAKPKSKHDSATSKSSLRRPGTPLTADRISFDKPCDSLKSPKRPALRDHDSVGKKLASVLQSGAMAVGLDRGKEQRLKNEE